jgi:hypothetical protein
MAAPGMDEPFAGTFDHLPLIYYGSLTRILS